MATQSVTALETELKILEEDISRMQEEHPDEEFPPEVASKWDWTNRKYEETKKHLQLERRKERLAEIKRSSPAQHEGPELSAGFQVGNAQWREEPWNLKTIDRSFDPAEEGSQFRDRAQHLVESKFQFQHPEVDQGEAKHRVSMMLDTIDSKDGNLSRHLIVNSSPTYKRALGKYIAGDILNTEEGEALQISRALSLTSAAGGYAVPVELDPTIMPTSNLAINPIRGIAKVRQISVDTFNGVTSGAVTAAYGAEATPTTDSSPTLGQVVISTERATSFIPFSIEIGQDWSALQSEMGQLLSDAKDVLEATKFTLGSGTNEPFGLITGATTVFTGSSATGFTLTDLMNWDESLPPRFQPNASVMMTKAAANRIRRIDAGVVGGAGSGVWIQNMTLQTGSASSGRFGADFLGYPAYQNTAMSSTFTTGQLIGVLGDFSYYIIIDRIGMNIEVIPHLFDVTFNQPTGQRGLYCYWRNGAKVADPAAFRTLKLG